MGQIEALQGQHDRVHMTVMGRSQHFKGLGHRRQLFAFQRPAQNLNRFSRQFGEAQTAHLFLPYVPQRIQQTVPDARLIVILRNPIGQAFSHWWMRHGNGREALNFEESLRENHARIAAGSTLEGAGAESFSNAIWTHGIINWSGFYS